MEDGRKAVKYLETYWILYVIMIRAKRETKSENGYKTI